ncbi:hypothetical protein D6C78_03173 [Aureobasidium pullulans]|uniref:Uncharacterized protein n=1 Tax=Aureobasidium pullulans TaxID=5580 RepID=A0A4S8TE44_AURPU|nr:hypothetical protein D6D29_04714 [Aureobasidium pullulans]TIA39596.1 hypothetical protein D6C78_03173 [Aureobasidium pullulans]
MSQDLLAEFGDFTLKDNSSGNQNYTPTQTQSSFSQANYGLNTYAGSVQPEDQGVSPRDDDDDDDEFGDFEESEPAPQQRIQATTKEAPIQPAKEVQPTPKPVSKPAPQPLPQPVKKSSGPPVILKKAAKASQLPSNHPFAGHADILFDADEYDEFEDADVVGSWGGEEDDEDDFGDFETSETPAVSSGTPKPTAPPAQPRTVKPSAPAASMGAVDLLGLDDPPETTNRANQPPAPSRAPKKTISAPKAPITRPTAAPRQQSMLSNDDAWDDFEISQPTQPAASQKAIAEAQTQIQLPKDILGDLTALPSTTGVAPSNIPPPSVLLTIFPPVLTSLSHQFLQPLSALSSSQKSLFLSNQETKSFLASYVTLTHVLGHVIAGRKSRWKRDKHLAQSMRIGPAMSGRSGGMKLTGLDKSESGREDTEVEVVLAVWREQVGRLKTAVTGASVHGSKLTVPELGDVLPVRVAKGSEGAITSTQACALCGLKREERVAKVDVAVEDSFGEFWVEGTNMHRACLKFWEVFKGRLMSR